MTAERSEDLRHRFRELAEALDRIHEEWQIASGRDDLEAEKRLIIRETALLAEIDQVVREFRDIVMSRRPRQ